MGKTSSSFTGSADASYSCHKFNGVLLFMKSPYPQNWVCRSLLSLGVKRGCTGAVVYSDGFKVEGSRVPWRRTCSLSLHAKSQCIFFN